jgi:hypothetical protein
MYQHSLLPRGSPRFLASSSLGWTCTESRWLVNRYFASNGSRSSPTNQISPMRRPGAGVNTGGSFVRPHGFSTYRVRNFMDRAFVPTGPRFNQDWNRFGDTFLYDVY